jgi:hypothetical protein
MISAPESMICVAVPQDAVISVSDSMICPRGAMAQVSEIMISASELVISVRERMICTRSVDDQCVGKHDLDP